MGNPTWRSAAMVAVVLMATGCYLEAGVGYYPRVSQGSGDTAESSAATGIVLNVGFYFDVPYGYRCAWGCAPYSLGVATGGANVKMGDADTAMEYSNGRGTELRLDADLPSWRRYGEYKYRATAIYRRVSSGEAHFRSGTDTMDAPSGHNLFAGLTFAKRTNYAGLTLGVAHMSWEGPDPATRVSAFGAQARLVVALPSALLFKALGFMNFNISQEALSRGTRASTSSPSKSTPTKKAPSGQTCTYETVCSSRTDGRCETVKRCR